MPKALAATVLTISVVLGLAACSSDSKKSSDTTSSSKSGGGAQTDPVTLSGTVNNKGTKDVSTKGASTALEVELDNFYFGPTFIKVAPGQKVTLELANEGSVAHTFTAPSVNIDKVLQPDAKEKVEVTAPASGNVEFYCRFHRDSGMQGALFETAS